MPIADVIERDVIEAMKAGEKSRVIVLRQLKSALKNATIAYGDTLGEDEVLRVVGKGGKKVERFFD